jgi:hypothetical protein
MTKRQRKAIGRHLITRKSRLEVDSSGNKMKKTAMDLKKGTNFGPTSLVFIKLLVKSV